jgi:hypothetical protein
MPASRCDQIPASVQWLSPDTGWSLGEEPQFFMTGCGSLYSATREEAMADFKKQWLS